MASDLTRKKAKIENYPEVRRRFLQRVTERVAPAPDPFSSFAILFGEVVPLPIVRKVQTLYATLQHSFRGYLYCFRDTRDPANIYKVGKTTKQPAKRIAEWRRDLAADATQLFLVAYAPCHNCTLGELTMFALLTLYRKRRYNLLSYRELTEYVEVDSEQNLTTLLHAVAWHVNTVRPLPAWRN